MKIDYMNELKSMAEPKYQKFAFSLIPNEKSENVLGVRLPKIRALAKRIAKKEAQEFLELPVGKTLEEKLLFGFVIAYADLSLDERLLKIEGFVPHINSWSVCDSFVVSLKFIRENKKEVWQFLKSYFESDKPYYIRFAVVTALNFYIDDEHRDELFKIFESIGNDDYYVKMAIAWATCEIFNKYPDETLEFLSKNSLDEDTHNKTIRKIVESYKNEPEYKEKAKKLKR